MRREILMAMTMLGVTEAGMVSEAEGDAEAAAAVHREAHGLMASHVKEVTGDGALWVPTPTRTPAPGRKLFLDRHQLGAGKVTAKDVAAAHHKDLAVQAKHQVRFLNYWF